jgi:hypothetical protein
MVSQQEKDDPVSAKLFLKESEKAVIRDMADIAEKGQIRSRLFNWEVVRRMRLEMQV